MPLGLLNAFDKHLLVILDEFASIVSHDLRNPLTVAQGRLPVVAEECDSEHVDAVIDAVERIDRILENTLTLARQGDTGGETQPVDPSALAERCWRTIDTADAELLVADVPAVEADPDRLKRVFDSRGRRGARLHEP